MKTGSMRIEPYAMCELLTQTDTTPVRVLTVSGALGAKAISLQTDKPIFTPRNWQSGNN